MAFKFVVFSVLLAAANAGYLGAPAVSYAAAPAYYGSPYSGAVGSQTQSVVRSADGNSAISTYSKAVDTAYSSVRKYDSRASNDAIAYPAVAKYAAPVAYAAAPAYAPAAYAAPAYAPAAYAAPAYAHAAYAAPVAKVAAPLAYAAPVAKVAAPLAYAAPVAKVAAPLAYSAPVAAHGGLLGVAYSPATSVAHISYSNPIVSYAY